MLSYMDHRKERDQYLNCYRIRLKVVRWEVTLSVKQDVNAAPWVYIGPPSTAEDGTTLNRRRAENKR